MQNSILEQVKMAEWGVDYIKRAAQVKSQPNWWDSLGK